MTNSIVKIKLSEIKPNPNRDLRLNPYNEEKITALINSINETGFWTNVIVRRSPDGDGYEQAYGHHRVEAARRAGITEADFVVQDLDENTMLKMMDKENQEEYRYSVLSMLETVKAVVNALAEGRIQPFDHVDRSGKVNTGAGLRYAPSFRLGIKEGREDKAYTTTDIAKLLGRTWTPGSDNETEKADKKVRTAVDALHLVEIGAIKPRDIQEMNWSQVTRFVSDIKARLLASKQTEEKIRKQFEAIRAENLHIQAEQKERERKAKEEYEAILNKAAEARLAINLKEVERLRKLLEEKDIAFKRKEKEDVAKKIALDQKLAHVKQEAEEAKRRDEYAPIRMHVDRVVHLLERRYEQEEVKSLSRKAMNASDRERVRRAALDKGIWLKESVADMFLPPLSNKRQRSGKGTPMSLAR
jgi:hypothetical protein